MKSQLYRNIYKTGNGKYKVSKMIKGETITYKTCDTLSEAIDYRDKVKANNWQRLPPTPEEIYEMECRKYYLHVQASQGRYYNVFNFKNEYIANTKRIEEALYFRDMYYKCERKDVPSLGDVDMTDNPYLKNGLEYPLPERLQLPERNSRYGQGSIVKKGETSYHVRYGRKGGGYSDYVCACPTLEMAEYVRMEMQKADWDKSKLQQIIDDYPKYYTYLLFFYQYVSKHKNAQGEFTGKWRLIPPVEVTDGKLEPTTYNRVEDALFERDFLKENGWDYDLLVEQIDDTKNPYYDMDLPPYPTRRIKSVRERNYHEKELEQIVEYIREDKQQQEICDILGISTVTLRYWLRKGYDTNFAEFKELVLNGENPLDVLEKQEVIYQPDLSRKKPSNFSNWVSYLKRNDRWQVRKGKITYGLYPSEELAHKISNELQKCNWDKSKLEAIQAKFGFKSMVNSKRWVYPQGSKWAVRRKDKNRKMHTYGSWYDKRIAIIVRDMLLLYGFNLENRDWIVDMAEWIVQMIDLCECSMFGKSTVEDIAYLEADQRIPFTQQNSNGRYMVRRQIRGKNIYYGTFEEDKAIEVVEFLQDNNWDKDLLKAMQEIGEI